ncbi:pentapeptide repeat-containing protein [Pseudomonas farris]
MANSSHVAILRTGTNAWNLWRSRHPNIRPDLSGADLSGVKLCGGERDSAYYASLLTADDPCKSTMDNFRDGADLRGVNLQNANLSAANLYYCDLSGANLSGVILSRAVLCWCRFVETNFYFANLCEADAHHAKFVGCNLDRSDFGSGTLSSANFFECSGTEISLFDSDLTNTTFQDTTLSSCDMTYAKLVRTKFIRSNLSEVKIYGVSVWDVLTDGSKISGLVITPDDQGKITVDDFDIAQFLYLVLENKRLRRVIESVTGKMVLILGCFSLDRKKILDALKIKLRESGFIPVLFDFDRPAGRNLEEVVGLLAHMSCFVLADITDAKCIPQELHRVIPTLTSVPVQPLISAGATPYAMFSDFGDYLSVLKPYVYDNEEELLAGIDSSVLPAIHARIKENQDRRIEFEQYVMNLGRPN